MQHTQPDNHHWHCGLFCVWMFRPNLTIVPTIVGIAVNSEHPPLAMNKQKTTVVVLVSITWEFLSLNINLNIILVFPREGKLKTSPGMWPLSEPSKKTVREVSDSFWAILSFNQRAFFFQTSSWAPTGISSDMSLYRAETQLKSRILLTNKSFTLIASACADRLQ